jgi:membrane-bound lytic murein transglycosylase D
LALRYRRLLACALASLLAAACAQVPGPDSAPALAADQTSAPPAGAAVALEPASPAVAVSATSDAMPPIEPTLEIKDPQLPRTIDLTRAPDDIWERIRNGFAMPDLDSPLVLDRQLWYASRPDYVKRIVERSRRYLYHIVEEVEKRGMPTEIALLPMVESAFDPMAYSRSHASGLWQFIPSTGKNYKLQQNWWSDSRRDILASTTAALDYLQYIYEMHGDWHLALASYNLGENGIARAIEKNKAKHLPTDFLSLKLPIETRYYVPKLQALKNIIMNPAAFGIDLDSIPNQPYFVTLPKTPDIDIRLAAQFAEMPMEDLIALNPAYNRPVITGPQLRTLVLPADRAEIFQTNLENHDQPLVSWQTYSFKPGDKLERLAAAHGITLASLKLVNGITSRTRVGPGTKLVIPIKGTSAGADPLPTLFHQPPVPEPRMRKLAYVVKKGDTLYGIAQRYRVRIDDLRRWNKISGLTQGEKLVIHVRAAAPTRKIRKHATKKNGNVVVSVASIKRNVTPQ